MVQTRAVFWCVKVKDFLPRTAGLTGRDGERGGVVKSQVVKGLPLGKGLNDGSMKVISISSIFILSYPIPSYYILSYPIISYPILSYHIISYPIFIPGGGNCV